MNNTPFKQFLMSKGLTPKDIVPLGIPYGTVLAHYYGSRRMSLTSAQKYADCLGCNLSDIISFYEHTPDLWPPDTAHEQPVTAKQDA